MSYWDLSEKGRSALEHKDVETYIDFELMNAGVLRARPLELVDEPEMPEPDGEVFVAQCGAYHHSEVAFASEEEARASITGALGKVTGKRYGDYTHGVEIKRLAPFDQDTAAGDLIRRVPVYSDERIAVMQGLLEKATEARAENSRRRSRYDQETDKQTEALKGMWADWHECMAKAAEMKRVNDTLVRYVEMAKGDEEIARGFLMKAFDADTVEEAEAWNAPASA